MRGQGRRIDKAWYNIPPQVNLDFNGKELTNVTLNAVVLKGTITASGTVTIPAVTLGGAVAGGDQAFTNVGDMTFAAGSILASGSTNGNTLLLRANDTTFITFTTGTTDACTLDGVTLSGTILASGTVTIPAVTLGGAVSGGAQALNNLGYVRMGTANDYSSSVNQWLQTSVSANYGGAAFTSWSVTATHCPLIDLMASRSDTIGTHAIVASGDQLGAIIARGSDGTAFRGAAGIYFLVDGTPGASDMPGRISFQTTADGSATLTDRWHINAAGNLVAQGNYTISSTGTLTLGAVTLGGTVTGGSQTVNALGRVGIGVAADAGALLYTAYTITATGGVTQGVWSEASANVTSGASSAVLRGNQSSVKVAATNTQNLTESLYSYFAYGEVATGATGILSNMFGYFAQASIGAATVTNYYGAYLSNPTGAGAVTNAYGLYIPAITKGATLNRAIFVAGGISEFDGAIYADGGITLGGAVTANGQAISEFVWSGTNYYKNADNGLLNISGGSGADSARIVLWGKTEGTSPGSFAIRTPGVSPGFADTERFNISGAIATAVLTLSAVTVTGLSLSGALDANGQSITGLLNLAATGSPYTYIGSSGTGWILRTKTDADASATRVTIPGGAATVAITWENATHSGLNITSGQVLQVNSVQVVGARQIDARIDDVPNSGDVTTDGIIAALQACVQTHGLMAAA